jgi:hypothetical protein
MKPRTTLPQLMRAGELDFARDGFEQRRSRGFCWSDGAHASEIEAVDYVDGGHVKIWRTPALLDFLHVARESS